MCFNKLKFFISNIFLIKKQTYSLILNIIFYWLVFIFLLSDNNDTDMRCYILLLHLLTTIT